MHGNQVKGRKAPEPCLRQPENCYKARCEVSWVTKWLHYSSILNTKDIDALMLSMQRGLSHSLKWIEIRENTLCRPVSSMLASHYGVCQVPLDPGRKKTCNQSQEALLETNRYSVSWISIIKIVLCKQALVRRKKSSLV